MTRRSRTLDVLLRVRRFERDARARTHERRSRERDVAEHEANTREATAQAQQDSLDRLAETGVIAAVWRSFCASVDTAHASARAMRAAAGKAEARESEARTHRLEAERAVAGLERLLERRARTRRVRARRADQRRLDDSALRRPGRLGNIALLFAVSLLTLQPEFAEAGSRVESASLERLLSDIRTRTAELDRRASELDEREHAVAELEDAVAERILELDTVAKHVEDRIGAWEEANAARSVAKLARIYGAMPPTRAAELVEAIELELATQVLAKMKPKQSAALLPLLSEPRALSISRFLGHPLGIAPTPAAPEKP